MSTHLITLLLLLFTGLHSYARGPAVEDFVGIDVQETPANLEGAHVFYNLQQDVQLIAQAEQPLSIESTTTRRASRPWSASALFALITLLGLPLIAWSIAMNNFRRKALEENLANIEVLDHYRKQKLDESTNDEDQVNVS